MVQLLIVEDEKWEREGLLNFLDWKGMGIEVAGCACNGVEGKKMAEIIRPQIIITDIRMPVLDGLQMSRDIRAFLPDTKIIILSGYDDFEYARQSFHFQASAYLLKPVQKKELEEAIGNVLQKLKEEKLRHHEKEVLERQWLDYVHTNLEHLLIDYLKDKTEFKYIRDLPRIKKLNGSANKVIVIFSLSVDSTKAKHKDGLQGGILQEAVQLLNQLLGLRGIAVLNGELSEAVICMNAPGTKQELEAELLEMMEQIWSQTPIQCIAGVGEVVEGFEMAPQSYSQARETIGFRFLANYGEILFYNSMKDSDQKDRDLSGQLLEKCDILSGKIVHHLQKGEINQCIGFVDNFLAMLRKDRPKSKLLLNRFVMNIVNGLNMLPPFSGDNGVYLALWDPNQRGVESSLFDSLTQTRSYLTGFLSRIAVNTEKNCCEDHVARMVLEIIEERYSEELNLKRVSEVIHLSAYYIGSIFKEYTGTHFNQYLKDFRIQKAKEMLQQKNVKISDLAEAVGIPNTSYFCSQFKSKVGMSPGEYMERMSRNNADV